MVNGRDTISTNIYLLVECGLHDDDRDHCGRIQVVQQWSCGMEVRIELDGLLKYRCSCRRPEQEFIPHLFVVVEKKRRSSGSCEWEALAKEKEFNAYCCYHCCTEWREEYIQQRKIQRRDKEWNVIESCYNSRNYYFGDYIQSENGGKSKQALELGLLLFMLVPLLNINSNNKTTWTRKLRKALDGKVCRSLLNLSATGGSPRMTSNATIGECWCSPLIWWSRTVTI